METFLILLAWFLSCFIPLTYMSWEGCRTYTWANLGGTAAISLIVGPILGVIIVIMIIGQSGFWDRPVFRCKKTDDNV
jgi:ABC-type phosphate transport system auxiliary subunit